SKTLDDGSEDQGWSIWNSQWRDFYNRKIEYSISSHDVPQSFVTSLVYDLPVGRGKKYGSSMNSIADKVVGGWQIASVVSFRSGLPLIIGANGNSLQGLGFGRAAANLVSTKLLNVPNRTPDNWFNPCTRQPDGSLVDCAPGQAVAWTFP